MCGRTGLHAARSRSSAHGCRSLGDPHEHQRKTTDVFPSAGQAPLGNGGRRAKPAQLGRSKSNLLRALSPSDSVLLGEAHTLSQHQTFQKDEGPLDIQRRRAGREAERVPWKAGSERHRLPNEAQRLSERRSAGLGGQMKVPRPPRSRVENACGAKKCVPAL